MRKRLLLLPLVLILMIPIGQLIGSAPPASRWTESKAIVWYQRYPWILGCNFISSTASTMPLWVRRL